MHRTRKWAYLGPKAQQLSALGLSSTEIADQIGVNRSTVQRWMAAGRLADTREPRLGDASGPVITETPAPDWAAAIRAAFALDPTDRQLVELAAFALSVSQTASELPSIRLAAAGRFQSLVKQLATRIRPAADNQAPARAATARADPRALLMPTLQ